jgi:hypothetical protein
VRVAAEQLGSGEAIGEPLRPHQRGHSARSPHDAPVGDDPPVAEAEHVPRSHIAVDKPERVRRRVLNSVPGISAKTEYAVSRDGRVVRIDLVVAENLGVALNYNIAPSELRSALAQVDDYMQMWPDRPMFLLLCGRSIQPEHAKTFFGPEVVRRRPRPRADARSAIREYLSLDWSHPAADSTDGTPTSSRNAVNLLSDRIWSDLIADTSRERSMPTS